MLPPSLFVKLIETLKKIGANSSIHSTKTRKKSKHCQEVVGEDIKLLQLACDKNVLASVENIV